MALFTKIIPYEKSVHENRRVESHEHRAPTDQSVALLREMEEKARDSVFATLRCDSNQFKCSAMVQDDYLTGDFIVRAKFTLNETTHDVEKRIPFFDLQASGSRDKLAVVIRDMLAVEIANKIVIDALADSWRTRTGGVK